MPSREEIAETASALLALARTPLDVRTDGNGNEFVVPQYLADLYTAPAAPKRRRTKKEEGTE